MASTTTALDITIQLLLSGTYQGAGQLNIPGEQIGYPSSAPKSTRYTLGTGSGQANFKLDRVLSLVSATPQSLDLVAGVTGAPADVFGQTCNLASIKLFAIGNRSTTTAQTVTITGNAVTTGAIFGSVTNIVLQPSEFKLLLNSPVDGKTLTAGTADTVTFTSNANFDMDVFILGIQI